MDRLVAVRQTNHSAIAIQELMHAVGVLDPAHPGTTTVIRQIGMVIKAMPPHRIFTPDADLLGRAAVLAGILCRLQGYTKDDRLKALHDAVLFLQALKLGLTLLTRNIRDFDYLSQMLPPARLLFYRRQA